MENLIANPQIALNVKPKRKEKLVMKIQEKVRNPENPLQNYHAKAREMWKVDLLRFRIGDVKYHVVEQDRARTKS